MAQRIIDISLPLRDGSWVYPGNPPIAITEFRALTPGGTSLSNISFGSHSGTHVDAPKHVLADGASIDEVPLERLVGPCQVFDLTHLEQAIGVRDVGQLPIVEGMRVLFKTRNSVRGFATFADDFIAIDGDAAEYLAGKGILSVGIDYLSVKPRGTTDPRPHTAFLEKGIPVIEGIDLSQVAEGVYSLVCLPLRFVGIEGAPARAILLAEV